MRSGNRTSDRTNRISRLLGYGSAVAALAVTAMMLLVPVSQAAGVSTLTSIPFKSIGVSTSVSQSSGACSKAKTLTMPHWTGTAFLTSAKVTSPKCRAQASPNFASWDAYVNLQVPIHFKTSGSHNVSVSWHLTAAGSWLVTPFGGCSLNYNVPQSYCESYADVFVTGYAYLVDANYSYFNFVSGSSGVNNYSTVENYTNEVCSGSSCTHYTSNYSTATLSGSVSGSSYQNETVGAFGTYAVNKTVSYTLYATLLVIVDVGAEIFNAKAITGGSAAASMNMGTLGNGAALVGITVT